jgi:SPP1 gp7 family putative phage head morphogenesis protein
MKVITAKPPNYRTERAAYVRFLSAHWEIWSERARQILDVARPSPRRDAFESETLRAAFDQLFSDQALGAFLRRLADSLDRKAQRYVQNVIRLPQRDVLRTDLIDAFRHRNVRLIKNMAADHVKDLTQTLRAGNAAGLRHEEIAAQINERLQVGKSRALLIARDQTAKINSQINHVRQVAAGIDEFQWSTSRDGAVRESHARLEGRVFRYDSPPLVDGEHILPGEAIQCRCVALPVIPEFASPRRGKVRT